MINLFKILSLQKKIGWLGKGKRQSKLYWELNKQSINIQICCTQKFEQGLKYDSSSNWYEFISAKLKYIRVQELFLPLSKISHNFLITSTPYSPECNFLIKQQQK